MRYRIRTIRELMALWEQWYLFMQPAGTPLPAWEEREVFNNILPWTAASSAGGVSKEHLEFKLYSAVQELYRCEEELLFLPADAVSTLDYYQFLREAVHTAAEAVQSQLAAANTPAEQASLTGRLHILRSWFNQLGAL